MQEYTSNYDKFPTTTIQGHDGEAWSGRAAVFQTLAQAAARHGGKTVLTVEAYPGVRREELAALLAPLAPALTVIADDCAYQGEALDRLMQEELTDDRVFGILTTHTMEHYFDADRLAAARRAVERAQGLVVVAGTGASLVHPGDILVYADLPRWEIQLRYRAGMSNWNTENADAPILTKYKRGFFIEWRIADKVKKQLLGRLDYLLDTTRADAPVLVTGAALRAGLCQVSAQPFRVQPYFDPGVWGGQWMKRVCGLPEEAENFAWSFDGVPEENSLRMRYGEAVLEIPAIDLVFYRPHELLGEHVHARFGTEFPIRFDFLDTMGGQNLSLQVHPLTEYIQDTFNMRYTQDESYYILDAGEGACVYLGVREGVDREAMLRDLRRAQAGEISFPAEQYVNKIPVQKHDHVLIPAGTIHCSGANAMVLEISATPYIFTFKLWDWDRLGLDGLPRPIHIDHGEKNIQWDRDTPWVMRNLVGRVEPIAAEEGMRRERTGLHEREFIDTERTWFEKRVAFDTRDSVNVLNLVEGRAAVITSPDGAFAPFTVHYAETFIIPAAVRRYCMEPAEGDSAAVICALVRR